ncbi:MAG: glycosyltransferase family 4 protein, partial [Thermodesulfobacteriota bacterium]
GGGKGLWPLAPSPNQHTLNMKIAVLRQRVGALGGAEATLGYLVRGLAAAGHEVVVYAADAGPEAGLPLGPGVKSVPVPVWGGKAGRLLSYALNSRRLLKQAGVQMVFSLERTLFQQVYRAGDGCHREWLERWTPFLSPAARLGQQFSLFHRVMLGLEARLFAAPGLLRVIANSRQVQEEIIRHYQVAPDKIRIIFNGLDHERFQPGPAGSGTITGSQSGAPPGAKIILFVGSGFIRKGLAYLIEAFSCLTDQESLLWVVGKGSVRRYQQLAARFGVAGRVKFWGPQTEVAPFYQAAAVLALPTIYDPCSNVVLEALGCGCPVVTTAGNGAKEFITPGVNGAILAQPHDIPALAQALQEFAAAGRDPQVRQKAQEAVAHLSWDQTTSQTLTVLEEAAAGGGR